MDRIKIQEANIKKPYYAWYIFILASNRVEFQHS